MALEETPNLAAAITQKVGPLPLWQWAVITIGGYVVYRHFHPAAASSANSAVNNAAGQVPIDPITGQPVTQLDYLNGLIGSNYDLQNQLGVLNSSVGAANTALTQNTTADKQNTIAVSGNTVAITGKAQPKPTKQQVANLGVQYHGWNAELSKLKGQLARNPRDPKLKANVDYAQRKTAGLYTAYINAANLAGVGAK